MHTKISWRGAWQPTPVFLPGESPWTPVPGELQSMGSHRVGHAWVTKHSTAQECVAAISTGFLILLILPKETQHHVSDAGLEQRENGHNLAKDWHLGNSLKLSFPIAQPLFYQSNCFRLLGPIYSLLQLLSHFSHVWLCAIPEMEPTRLPRPWDSPGKDTGVGCHYLLQCVKGKRESEAAPSCPTPSNPMDCNPPGSSIHGIFQARVLECGAIAFSDIH